MVHTLRRFQQPLMIALTILVIIAFAFLYNSSSLEKVGSDSVATLYGRPISQAQYLRAARKIDLCQNLFLYELLRTLTAQARSMEQGQQDFIFNSFVLEHEADRLGLTATDAEIEQAIKALPAFQTSGQFDSARYNMFIQNLVTPRGFTGSVIDELVRDDIILGKLKALLGTTSIPAPGEIREIYEMGNRTYETSVVRLKLADFLATAQITDEDLKKTYEERKAGFTTDEKRKVKFVAFTLADQEKPLVGKERVEQLKQLMEKANQFALAMVEKDAKFDEVATILAVKVAETPEFPVDDAPSELNESEAVAKAAFTLTDKDPNSDVLAADIGYYVLQLAGISPSRPQTFEEAKGKLADALKNERAMEAMNLKGAEIRNKIEAGIKAGKSFADAATEAGAKAETVPPFSLAEQRKLKDPDAQDIVASASEMKEGEVSTFTMNAMGGVIVHLAKRVPIDEAKFETEKVKTAKQLADFRARSVFAEWLKLRRKEAGVPAVPAGPGA